MGSELQNKLLDFKADPPKEAWNRISAALDDAPFHIVGEKMAAFEASPPADTWKKIRQYLDEHTPARVVPFLKQYSRPLKYGGAIAILAVVLFLSTLMMNKGSVYESNIQPVVKNNPSVKRNNSDPAPGLKKNYTVNTEERIAEQKYTRTSSITHEANRRNRRTLSTAALTASYSTSGHIPKVAERNSVLAFSQPVDKYMVYSREDGNAVKMPRKLFDAIACPLKDAECRMKLKQVREKFAASAFSADFTGVLDLLNNLGENQ